MSVSCGECGYAGTLPTPLLDTCSAKNVFLGRAQTEMKRFYLGQRSCPISSARDPHCAMGCFASRPRVDDPAATSRIDRSDPTTTSSSSPERRHVPATSSRRHRRGPRGDLTVRVPDDDDDDGSDGDDDPDAVRAIVMVQSPDHIVTASTMRVSRGRSSLYESTADRHASASSSCSLNVHDSSDHPCASATTTGTSACSLPGATMVTSPAAAASSGAHAHIGGGMDGHLTHEAIELERATREVRRACAVVAAAATTSKSSSGDGKYLSSSGLSTLSNGSSSIDRSRSRSSSRCPSRGSDRGSYHGDLAAVESDVIAKVARLVYFYFRMYGQLE